MKAYLRSWRRKNEISQKTVANALNMSVTYYNMVENGVRKVPKGFYEKLKEHFKLSDYVIKKMKEE